MTIKSLITLILTGMLLSACSMFSSNGKYAPDEFEVVDRAPLVVPPEANLTPPRPGEPKAQNIDPGRIAYEALFPGKTVTPPPSGSGGELSLLRRMPSLGPDVRSNAGQKDLDVTKKRLLLADMLDAEERSFQPDNITIERVNSGS